MGSQPRPTLKSCMSSRPSQKLGTEMPEMAMTMQTRSSGLPRFTAEMTPRKMPMMADQVMEQIVR